MEPICLDCQTGGKKIILNLQIRS